MRDIIANIIDPHSFLPDNSGCDLTAEMVRQGKALAYSKTDRIFEALASSDLPDEPKRLDLDRSEMKFGTCPQCGTRQNLARAEDESLICGSCADGNYLAEWIDYGRDLRRRATPSPAPNLRAIADAAQAYVDAVNGEPEKDCWDTEDGKEAPGALRFASDWAWQEYDGRKQKAFDALRAATSASEVSE